MSVYLIASIAENLSTLLTYMHQGQAIDGVQLNYITPKGEKLSQAYYRSQTTKRSGWLKVSADNGSIPGLDSYAGIFGELLDRLQIGISQSNPF